MTGWDIRRLPSISVASSAQPSSVVGGLAVDVCLDVLSAEESAELWTENILTYL